MPFLGVVFPETKHAVEGVPTHCETNPAWFSLGFPGNHRGPPLLERQQLDPRLVGFSRVAARKPNTFSCINMLKDFTAKAEALVLMILVGWLGCAQCKMESPEAEL